MKSIRRPTCCVSICRDRATVRHACAFILLVPLLHAQPGAGTIATQPLPTSGPTIFDAAGNVYNLNGGPVTPGAAQTQTGGGTCYVASGFIGLVPTPCSDAHIAKLDPAGNVVFGTLLGGPTDDAGSALAVDAPGNVYVVGNTGGSFPTTPNAANPSSSISKAFAAKLSADGSRFLYSTYLPDNAATASGIAVDRQGNAYIVGKTLDNHAYVVKLSGNGSTFLYTETLGGSGQDAALAIAVDAAGNALIAGQTSSSDFPVTAGALQSKLAGTQNVFVAKLDSGGHTVFATYLGGSGSDQPNVMLIDGVGGLYVAGSTTSLDFPVTAGSFQPTALVPLWNNLGPGGFVAKLTADATALVYSSYVMTTDSRQPGVSSLALGSSGDLYLAGLTGPGFPVTTSAPQVCLSGPLDAFVAHLDLHGTLLDATYVPNPNAIGGANFVHGLTLGADGSALLVWHSSGNDVLSRVHFGEPGFTSPACLSPYVPNAASLVTNSQIAPGEFVTLTGFGIGPETGVAYQPDAQGMVPRQLAGVQVLFDGQPAPVLYAQSRQVSVLVPFELNAGDLLGKTSATVSLVYNSKSIGSASAQVLWGMPALFRLAPGLSTQALALNEDGTLNGPSNPAARGSVVTFWGTGFGPTNPPCATSGLNVPTAASLATGLGASIQGGGAVLYTGSAPTLLCGVEQLNMVVPENARPGGLPLAPRSTLTMANSESAVESPLASTILVK